MAQKYITEKAIEFSKAKIICSYQYEKYEQYEK